VSRAPIDRDSTRARSRFPRFSKFANLEIRATDSARNSEIVMCLFVDDAARDDFPESFVQFALTLS